MQGYKSYRRRQKRKERLNYRLRVENNRKVGERASGVVARPGDNGARGRERKKWC